MDDSTLAGDGSAVEDTAVDSEPSTVDMPARVTEHGSPEPFQSPAEPWVVIVGILLILGLFALGALGLGRTLGPGDSEEVAIVVVPRGIGRPAMQVQQQIEKLGLFVEIRYASNETAPADTVTEQTPIGGSRLDAGKLVTLTVSDGPAGIRVPDASGLRPMAATNLFQVVGLTTTIEEVYDDKVRVGEVASTVPEAGGRAAVGSSVIVRISKGPKPRVVPEVTGLAEPNAFALIAAAELQIGKIKRTVTSDLADGTIMSSSPGAASEVPRSTPIDLVIAEAPSQITIPDLAAMTRASANSVASSLGFKLKITTLSVPAGDTRGGIVLSQSPIAGSTIDKGATVEVVVGLAPSPPTTTTTTTTTTTPGD